MSWNPLHFHKIQQPQIGEWRWYKQLKASKESLTNGLWKSKRQMNQCYAFSRRRFIRCPPRHLAVEDSLTNCSDALHRWCVSSFGAKDLAAKTSLVASTRPSDRPTLPLDQGVSSSGAEDFILVRLCLDSNWVLDRPTVSSLRPSDHPVLLSSLLFLRYSSDGANFILPPAQCTNYTDAMHRWYRRFIRRCVFFSFLCSVLTLEK
jgi:hypothetical protein